MPTTRPRHTLTETEELERALDLAAARWPEDAPHRSRLLARIVNDWVGGNEAVHDARRHAVLETAGAAPGLASEGALSELHDEWPP